MQKRAWGPRKAGLNTFDSDNQVKNTVNEPVLQSRGGPGQFGPRQRREMSMTREINPVRTIVPCHRHPELTAHPASTENEHTAKLPGKTVR